MLVKPEAYLQIIRPMNCIMMGFAVIVGASLVSNLTFSINLLYGFITAFSLTAASMVINDYYDREIDKINEPNRPIPSGSITPNQALAYAIVLTVIGFVSAFLTNMPSFAVALFASVISVGYITKGKKTGLFGNFLVSATVVTPFVYGGLTVGNLQMSTLIFVAMAFLSNTGREITKGIVDVEGDRAHNVKTVAVRFGAQKAAVVASVFSVAAVCLSPLPLFLGIVSIWFVQPVLITDAGLLVSAVLLLKNPSRENAKKTKQRNLIWFITGLLAFIMGTL